MASVTVGELLSALGAEDFRLAAGGLAGMRRRIGRRTVQRVGVALTGHTQHLVSDRVQLIGRSEGSYLDAAEATERATRLEELIAAGFPALVMTTGRTPPPELPALCDDAGCALIVTDLESIDATHRLEMALDDWLAPRASRHAVMVDVYGVGVLMIGKSGIGKSELGLELVTRGHRLVADDLVLMQQLGPTAVVGYSPELTRHHMEIRGLGIINIKDLFGAAAVRDRKRVELVVQLVEWDPAADYDRLGLESRTMELAGVPVEQVTLPVRPGRSLSLIIEVAARNRLLRAQGTHSAQAFAARLGAFIHHNAPTDQGGEIE